jgi:hypothetical protein
MGHDIPTMIGVDQRKVTEKINKLVPDYMAMGSTGGAMEGMQMALPENTLPMASGEGPFGSIGMGGMVTTIKIRKGQGRNDYRDPGWYKHPPGTVAREWTGTTPPTHHAPGTANTQEKADLRVRKPQGHDHH